ncbi:MAG: sugar phosphate isomerase/epimerase [Deltaproteobacteria bacterium]|nr:MAG: sugar phosphate isomerase/epimerase [Deltaproteobacteria bacterium]
MKNLIREIQINVPFVLLKNKYLSVVLKNRINPEIGIDSRSLDEFSRNQFAKVAKILQQEDLSVTLHAPFMDMVPGSPDLLMRKVTIKRLRQAFELLPVFEPLSIICHTGFNSQSYQNQVDSWLERSVESWLPLTELAQSAGTKLMLENVYEENPDLHVALLSRLNSPCAGFCFDIGHWHVFSRTDIGEWLGKLRPYLGQLHLHDNLGDTDSHLALGRGDIDFSSVFSCLKNCSPRPIITLEPHREEDVFKSVEALSTLWPWR